MKILSSGPATIIVTNPPRGSPATTASHRSPRPFEPLHRRSQSQEPSLATDPPSRDGKLTGANLNSAKARRILSQPARGMHQANRPVRCIFPRGQRMALQVRWPRQLSEARRRLLDRLARLTHITMPTFAVRSVYKPEMSRLGFAPLAAILTTSELSSDFACVFGPHRSAAPTA